MDRRTSWMCVMLFLLSTINCVDRLVLSSVAPILRDTLHLSNQQYSYIVMAFMAGMTLGQVPAGALLDRIGVRLGLPIILVGWSVINILHVGARQVFQFCALRLGMGVFESGNYSGGLKAIGQTMPAGSRAFALGFFNSGYLLGSVLAPPIVVYTANHFGWKASFVLPGLIGMLWIYPWWQTYRLAPSVEKPAALGVERPALRDLLKLREVWGVIALRATNGPVGQFYWYWLPLYLVRGRGASMQDMARFASMAYILGACGNLAGGYLSGWLIRHQVPVAKSRRILYVAGSLVCAGCTVMVPATQTVFEAGALTGIAIFGLNAANCNLLAIMSDVFPETALARVCGLTGAGEGIVTILLTLCTGIILDHFTFSSVFWGASVFPVISVAMLYLFIREAAQHETGQLVPAG